MNAFPPGRRLVFHIGHHKTGSTAIQNALATGAITVRGQRLLYTAQMAHNYLKRHVDAWAEDGRILPGSPGFANLAEIAERLARDDYDTALFSAEEFEGADPAVLARALDRFFLPQAGTAQILAWVRPHAARTLSSFAEQMKLGLFAGTPAEFHRRTLRAGRLNYARRLTPWTAVFGPAFRARPLVREVLAGGSVLQDFAEAAFGAQAEISIAPQETANESLSLPDLVALAHVQARLAGEGRGLRHALGWEMAHLLTAIPRPAGGEKLALDRALAETIRADYLADARALDRGLFAQVPVMERELDRAVDTALPQPQSFDPADHFDAEGLRWLELLAETAAALLANPGEAWQGYLLRRRIGRLHGQPPAAPADPRPARGRRRGAD